MKNKFWLLFLAGILFAASAWFFKFNGVGAEFLWNLSEGGKWLLPLISVAALVDSINPCAFSILLLTIAFLFSVGQRRNRILALGGVYILGIFVVYMFIGLGILQTLHLFSTPHFMAKVGAVLLMLLGFINLINEFFPSFPIKLRIPSAAHKYMAQLLETTSMPAAFLLGALVGVCEFPCTGGPYLMVLGLLHDNATYYSGLGYLFLYNLIFVLPLVIILLVSGDAALVSKVQEWKNLENNNMRLWGGVAMMILGILILFL